MKFNASRRSAGSVISLTPLIDCMFLLIIFIMIAARFEPESGIPVDLPKAVTADNTGDGRKADPIKVVITVDGKIYLDNDEMTDIDELKRRIIAARALAGDPDGEKVTLELHGDQGVTHGRMMEVYDAARQTRQRKILIRAKQ